MSPIQPDMSEPQQELHDQHERSVARESPIQPDIFRPLEEPHDQPGRSDVCQSAIQLDLLGPLDEPHDQHGRSVTPQSPIYPDISELLEEPHDQHETSGTLQFPDIFGPLEEPYDQHGTSDILQFPDMFGPLEEPHDQHGRSDTRQSPDMFGPLEEPHDQHGRSDTRHLQVQPDVFGPQEESHDQHGRPETPVLDYASLIPRPPRLTIPNSGIPAIKSREWLRPIPIPALSNRYPRLRNASDIHPALRKPQRPQTETAANPGPPRYIFPTESDEEDDILPKGKKNQKQKSETPVEVGSSSQTPQKTRKQDSSYAEDIPPQTPLQRYVPGNSWSEDAHRQRSQGSKTPMSSGKRSQRIGTNILEGETTSVSNSKKGKAPERQAPVRYLEDSNPYGERVLLARRSTANLREPAISPPGSPTSTRRFLSFSRKLKTARSLPVIGTSDDEIYWERPTPDKPLPEIPSLPYPLTSPILTNSPSEPSRVLSSDFVTPTRKVSFAEVAPQQQAPQSEHESRLVRYGKRVLSWGKKNKGSSEEKRKESSEQKKKDSPGGKKKESSLEKKKSTRNLFKKSSDGA